MLTTKRYVRAVMRAVTTQLQARVCSSFSARPRVYAPLNALRHAEVLRCAYRSANRRARDATLVIVGLHGRPSAPTSFELPVAGQVDAADKSRPAGIRLVMSQSWQHSNDRV